MNGIRAGVMHASLYLLLLYFVFFNFNDRLCDDFSRKKHVDHWIKTSYNFYSGTVVVVIV